MFLILQQHFSLSNCRRVPSRFSNYSQTRAYLSLAGAFTSVLIQHGLPANCADGCLSTTINSLTPFSWVRPAATTPTAMTMSAAGDATTGLFRRHSKPLAQYPGASAFNLFSATLRTTIHGDGAQFLVTLQTGSLLCHCKSTSASSCDPPSTRHLPSPFFLAILPRHSPFFPSASSTEN